MVDAKEIKENLTADDVTKIILALGGELRVETDEYLIFTSITYDKDASDHKAKLYYYIDSFNFMEYHTGESCDIYEIVRQRASLFGYEYSFLRCLRYVCDKLGIDCYADDSKPQKRNSYDWKSDLKQFVSSKKEEIYTTRYDDSVLDQFENNIYQLSWLQDHISIATMRKYDIRYYKFRSAVVIPCRDIDNKIVGIRGRFFGDSNLKYMPISMLDGTSYNFPTNDFLYGLNHTKVGIRKHKKCLVVEAEKSVMQADGYFGDDNFTVGLYGKAFNEKKRDMILQQGAEELIIGLDFDYNQVGDEDFQKFENNVYKIADVCKGYLKVSALVSYKGHKLKDSPTDNGKDFYLNLYNRREVIYK